MTALRRLGAEERGIGLVEFLVTMTILSIVGGLLVSAVVATERTRSVTDARVEDLGHAQVAIGAVTRSLRAAVVPAGELSAFVDATSERVEFYADVGGELVVGALSVPSHVVVQAVTLPDGQPALAESITPGQSVDPWQPAGPARERVLARGLDSQDVFTFHTQNDPDETFVPDPADVQSLRQIRAVTVDLSVLGADRPGVSASQLRNRVRMPNLTGA